MATSGSSDYSRTANDIVTRALRVMGVIAQEETPAAAEMEDGIEALNVLVKSWQAENLTLWKREEAILWLTAGTTKYSLGTTGDHAASTWVKTTLSADAASGAGSISVSSITGISDADNIGIILDDGTLQWDTVSGAPSGSTVTLTGTLNGAASSGNQVWAYTSKIVRPLKIDNPRRRNSSDQDIPIWLVSRQEYMDTPNKTAQAPIVNVYFDPQLTNAEVHLWPAPDTAKDTLLFTAKLPIEDFDSSTNNPDLPQEWLRALTWNLADELALEYEIPADRHARIERRAIQTKALLEPWDSEGTSIYMQPDFMA